MIDASKPKYVLASSASTPPTSSSYWVVPSLLLAGAYPGDSDPDERRRKMQALVDAGVRAFVNLMQEDETNWAGVPFVPYVDVAQQFCPNVVCVRHPIQDLSVPTASEMCDMLNTIDQYLESQKAVYTMLRKKYGVPTSVAKSHEQNSTSKEAEGISASWIFENLRVSFEGVGAATDEGTLSITTASAIEHVMKSPSTPATLQ